MLNAQVQSMFNDSKEMNDATVIVNVEMNPSELMDCLADELLGELLRINPNVKIGTEAVEKQDMYRYLVTLVWMRVNITSDAYDKSAQIYFKLNKALAVPVMAYQLLVMIGKAVDRDFSIEFRPTYSILETDLLDPMQMVAISDILTRMEPIGMKVVYGLPREKDGELDFMAMAHVGEVVKSYRHSHPVYGFYSAFFRQKQLNEITGSMCRVLYGYDSDYRLYIAKVFQQLNIVTRDI